MSVVLGGYGFGCVVTRGYGCPQPVISPIVDVICNVASGIDRRVLLISPIELSTMVMSFVKQETEIYSMTTVHCDIYSIAIQVVDLVSALDPPTEVELCSTVILTVDLVSKVCCC